MNISHKQLLFYHINSYWLYQLMKKSESDNNWLQPVKSQIFKKTKLVIESDFREGYELGELIYHNYQQKEKLALPEESRLLEKVEQYSPGYLIYLNNRLHAWAVPLSYRNCFDDNQNNTLKSGFDKKLNLYGSTCSHQLYFKILVTLIEKHFETFDELPVGLIDVGCGDGSMLRALKKALVKYERNLIYIGVDIDFRAVEIARSNDKDDILFLQGDVSDPDGLNKLFIQKGLPALDNFFHVRAFVDHNFSPQIINKSNAEDEYKYILNKQLLDRTNLQYALLEHYKRWKPYIYQHGIGIIELHSLQNPSLTESPALAYEIFHLLSEQYIDDYCTYMQLTNIAGWQLLNKILLPNEAVANVSISIFK